jgi:hypothetical protein
MGEGDHPAKEQALKRLSEPEGDHELHSVLERMRVHHPHLWERSTGCTSHTEPVPQNSRSGEGRRMVARRRSGLSTMTKPWASWRWGCSSPILVQRLLRLQATRVDGEHGQECTQLHTSG